MRPALPPLDARTRPLGAFQVVVVASLLGLIASGQHNLTMRATGGDPTLWHALGMGLPYWYLWAIFVPLVVWTARRYPFTRERWLRSAVVHLAIALAATVVHSLLEMGLQHAIGVRHGSFGPMTRLSVVRAFWLSPYNLLAYAAILGAVIAADSVRRARQGEVAAATLSAQLAEARLQALQTQLNPHFLFNAMNSISMLVRKRENEAAVTMIAGLSGLLRHFLDPDPPQEVPLREELAFVERYLAMERLRFQDRLQVTIDVEPRALDAYVPNLVLQPLVENALKHGIARRSSAGRLAIAAAANPAGLVLSVTDDGPGLNGNGDDLAAAQGVGLRNIRARLEHLYGPGSRLSLAERPEGGAVATVNLPFRTAPS